MTRAVHFMDAHVQVARLERNEFMFDYAHNLLQNFDAL